MLSSPAGGAVCHPQDCEQQESSETTDSSLLILPELTLQSQEGEELATDTKEVGSEEAENNRAKPTINVRKLPPTNYLTWNMPQIKALCKKRGIPRSETKPILVKRLNEWEKKNNTIMITPRTPKRARPEDNDTLNYSLELYS